MIQMGMHFLLRLTLLSLASISIAGTSDGAIFEVPSGFTPNIQSAIDACVPGDEVHVLPGTYTGEGNVDLRFGGVALRLLAIGGPAVTILDCEGDPVDPHRGLIFDAGEGPATVVEGFTIRNAWAPGTDRWGGAVLCLFGAAPTLRNCVLEHNDADRGAGVFAGAGASPSLEDCTLSDNHAELNGGGMSCMEDASATLVRCRILRNRSDKHAGGIGCLEGSNVTLVDCDVLGNEASSQGGGIFIDRSSPSMDGLLVTGNVAGRGAGVYVAHTSTVSVAATTIASNRAGVDGGGIYLRDTATMDGVTILLHANCAPLGADLRILGVTARFRLICSAARPERMEADPTTIDLPEDLVTADPQLCDPILCEDVPATTGDYTLDSASPCRASASPCGETIGAREVGCGDPVPTRSTSWGQLKSRWSREPAIRP